MCCGDRAQVQEMFNDLAILISQQGDTLDAVELHVEKSFDHVQKGTKELKKANDYAVRAPQT